MAIIYTNQSSGAIRRLKNRKPTKAYKEALKKHIKYLQKLGFDCDDTGRIQLTTSGGYYLDIAERTMPEPREKTLSDVPMSNKTIEVTVSDTIYLDKEGKRLNA